MIVFIKISKADFLAVKDIVKSSFIGQEYDYLVSEVPYDWFGDSSTDWMMILKNNNPCGFFLSRLVGNNYHLHSINVSGEYQGEGLGRKIIESHWKKGIKRNPYIDTYTLHVNQKNKSAIEFYKSLGYKKFNYGQAVKPESGLDNWVSNCQKKDDWPLREGLILYYMQR